MTKKTMLIFTNLMNVIMCIFMALTALLVNVGFLTVPMYLVTLVQALVICTLGTIIFRIPQVCTKAAAALAKGNMESKAFKIWNCLFNATFNTIVMNTFMTLINVGFSPIYFVAWLQGFPALEIVAIIVSFIANPFMMKLAFVLSKPKDMAEY